MKNKGFVTIPTDSNFIEGTKKYIDLWGADAVRDCDGVSLPKNAKELFDCEVYKAYFIIREDHEYAKNHPEYLQNVALITDRKLATSKTLDIDLLENIFKKSLEVNIDALDYMQVFDRTTGKLVNDYEYIGNNIVRINKAIPFHEYTVSFFAKNLWDPVQIYNYHSNNWKDVPIDIDIDPIYPEALKHMLDRMEQWCKSNPDITVVRFTTFFYNFFMVYKDGLHQSIWDWHTYAMSASPMMFNEFKKEYGEEITLEDLVTSGTYASRYQIPSKKTRCYIDMVQRKCCGWAKLFVDIVHKYNKKAMMFDGDHRIGTEPYNPYFASIGLDAVVGAPHSGPYIRLLTDMKGIKYTEGRLNPYFFPNECPSDELGCAYLNKNYLSERRGLLKKCIDRIGFGGYLKLVDSYPNFQKLAKQVCDEFRLIKSHVDKSGSFNFVKVAVMSYWGRQNSWMFNGNFTDDTKMETKGYGTFFNAICGQPVDVEFISFDDIINGNVDISKYDVLVNTGLEGSSFQGDYYWKNETLLTKIREYVYNGGGLIGIGSPSGYFYEGKYIQLGDIFGIEKERGFTYCKNKVFDKIDSNHWIISDLDLSKVKFVSSREMVYPIGATILSCSINENDPTQNTLQGGNIDFSVNTYNKGRAVYISGLLDSFEAFRLIYKSLLWASKKENSYQKALSSNPNIDCYYYSSSNSYSLLNNLDKEEKTTFFDIDGNKTEFSLAPHEIKWIERK